jgi:hypothetical protein
MAIDPNEEILLSLTEATKVLPHVKGKRPARSTLWRWCRKGLQGVHLEYVRVGRDIATSREALGRFFVALAAADRPLGPQTDVELSDVPTAGMDRTQERAVARAERRLAEAGI